MAIDLTYAGDATQPELDRAILMALGRKTGYVIELTYPTEATEDVVVSSSPTGDTLYCQRYDEETQGPFGPLFAVDVEDIAAIKIY